jgi:hypothetical protein
LAQTTAIDFFAVPTATFRVLFVFVVLWSYGQAKVGLREGGILVESSKKYERMMCVSNRSPRSSYWPLPLACAQQSETSAAPSPAWNDNSLIKIQKDGGDGTRSGDVKIEFYGHDAFKITSPAGLTILTDPWRNDPTVLYPKWFLNEFPALRVDIVLSTHAHFDHDAVERPNGLVVLERLTGQFKLGDIEVNGPRRQAPM